MPIRDAANFHEQISSVLRDQCDLRKLPDDWLIQSGFSNSASDSAVCQAVRAVYAKQVYACEKNLELCPKDEQVLAELRRVLHISPNEAAQVRQEVGIRLYRKLFQQSISDGVYSADENEQLNHARRHFALSKSETRGAVKDLALAHYAFMLAEAAKDQLISESELANLSAFAKQFHLTQEQLGSLSVPDAEAILRAALNEIKSNGAIDRSDFDYIRRLSTVLNAGKLLKPCLKDLELFEKVFHVRAGELPQVQLETLVLEAGEHLHYFAPVAYESAAGNRKTRRAGDLYVGSRRIRFVSAQKSHEIRYANLLEIQAHIPKTTKPQLQLSVSKGTGSGTYHLNRMDPGLAIELVEAIRFLVRKARGFEKSGGRDTSYVSKEVRSEVWYRDGGKCVICGANEYLEFDHIIPRSKGGATSVENLQLLCRRCNSKKSDTI